MADGYISHEREELYERVWAEPARKVAKRYRISDVAPGKICRRLSVSVPGSGYCAKKAGRQEGVRPAEAARAGQVAAERNPGPEPRRYAFFTGMSNRRR